MSAWNLTIRHGSDVNRSRYDDLDAAIAAMRETARAIKSEGPLDRIASLRDFEPAEQVHARLEISGKGLIRPPTAGIDIMGDGTFVPFSGGVRREFLELDRGEDPFHAVTSALSR